MTNKSYVLVANLKSRKASLAFHKVKQELAKKNVPIKIIEVDNPSGLTSAFQRALAAKPDVIILGGGDGTLISGIEYLTKKGYKKDIGLLPLGTANYLVRNLNIPLSIPESIEVLLRDKVREIPVGIANGKFFALTFIIGLTQAVSNNVSDDLKRKFGQLAYILELFKQSKNHQSFTYTIDSSDVDGTLHGVSHQILIYNSDINQQLKLVPEHKLDKPTLKLVISDSGTSKAKLFISFLTHIITLGKRRPFMRVYEVQSLKIQTNPALTADFDGESYGKSPYSINMGEQKIRIIC